MNFKKLIAVSTLTLVAACQQRGASESIATPEAARTPVPGVSADGGLSAAVRRVHLTGPIAMPGIPVEQAIQFGAPLYHGLAVFPCKPVTDRPHNSYSTAFGKCEGHETSGSAGLSFFSAVNAFGYTGINASAIKRPARVAD